MYASSCRVRFLLVISVDDWAADNVCSFLHSEQELRGEPRYAFDSQLDIMIFTVLTGVWSESGSRMGEGKRRCRSGPWDEGARGVHKEHFHMCRFCKFLSNQSWCPGSVFAIVSCSRHPQTPPKHPPRCRVWDDVTITFSHFQVFPTFFPSIFTYPSNRQKWSTGTSG